MSFLAKIDAQITSILLLIKQIPKCSNKKCIKLLRTSSNLVLPENDQQSIKILSLSTSKNNDQRNNSSNKLIVVSKSNTNNLINSENFVSSHLCNRDEEQIQDFSNHFD